MTKQLAEYVSAFTCADLGPSDLARLKLALCDWLAVALAGCSEEAARCVRGYVSAMAAPGKASVLGSTTGTLPHLAVLANATTGHVLDYDDITTLGSGHPGAPVVPAVLALAEQHGCGGRDMLTAMAAGINVELALGLAIMPGHYERGYHNTATLGRIGAAAAGCSLLHLPPETCAHALSIAAATASGLRESFGSMLKSVQVGMAAMDGVMAVEMAMRGIRGPQDVIGGRYGLFRVMAPSISAENLLEHLSAKRPLPAVPAVPGDTTPDEARTQTLIGTVRPKRYPSCLSTHGAIQAALRARPRIGDLSHITNIECTVHPLCLDIAAIPHPRTGLEAKFSAQYCIAAALVDGKVTLGSFTDKAVRRPAISELANKVRLTADHTYTRERECHLVLTLANGTQLESHARLFEPHTTDEDWQLVKRKFTEALGTSPDSAWLVEQVVGTILSLEALDTVAELTVLLRGYGFHDGDRT